MNSFSQILRSKQLQLIPNKRAVDMLVFFIIEWYRALTLQRCFDYELLKDGVQISRFRSGSSDRKRIIVAFVPVCPLVTVMMRMVDKKSLSIVDRSAHRHKKSSLQQLKSQFVVILLHTEIS
jgi:hypothetical protein